MKDVYNTCLPITETDLNLVANNEFRNLTSFSSNGYYGYQRIMEKHPHEEENLNNVQRMDVQMMDSDIQFNNLIPAENSHQRTTTDDRGQLKRKRCWGYDYEAQFPPEFKKRRENENEVITPTVSTPACQVNLRNPTHNVPDLPRCLMGHYI